MPNDILPMAAGALLEPSFADALRAIDTAGSLTAQQKTHWSCSVRQIGHALALPLETIPARWTSIRFRVKSLHHVKAGCREKTLQNHKSNVRAALLWFADEHDVAPRGVPLSADWLRLRERIEDVGPKRRLSGLMRYCSGNGIAPVAVTDETLEAYMAYRGATTRLADNIAARREVARAWNVCLDSMPGWPRRRLIEPPLKGPDGPTWSDFPQSLRRDIEGYLDSLMRVRRGARNKRWRPCKASTIGTRRQELVTVVKRAANIVPLETLTSLKAVLAPALVEQVLEAFWKQHSEQPGIFVIELGWKLLSVARQIGMEDADLEQLDEFRANLESYRPEGMTPKNMTLIRQVLNNEVWRGIIRLPALLMEEARRTEEHALVKAALIAQRAIAIAILSIAPIRLGNLGRIRLGENLIKPGGPAGHYYLLFPDHDVKNRVPLEYELDQRVTDLIDEYVETFRPALSHGSNQPWLFPGENGGHKMLASLGTQISDRILRATGIRMTVHQFRHAAAAILLKNRPGEYELVRRLLGHRNIQTTMKFYCGLETTQATRIYGDIISRELRHGLGEEQRPTP
jgi:integrase